MDRFQPKYVTFDCHRTLVNFQSILVRTAVRGRLQDQA